MSRLRVAVLASGSGTTFQNLVERSQAGRLDVEIAALAVSRADAFAKVRAESLGIPVSVLPSDAMRNPALLGAHIGDFLTAHRADLCVMAGFLKLWNIPSAFSGRVMNVHPALLPAFGGRLMYGHHVHDAVVRSGVKLTGATVHFADDEYDHGPIIVQRAVDVAFGDTADDVAARVQEVEREIYPEAIALFAAGRLAIVDRRVEIRASKS